MDPAVLRELTKPDFTRAADRYVRHLLQDSNKTEAELQEAAFNFAEYLSAVWDIAEETID